MRLSVGPLILIGCLVSGLVLGFAHHSRHDVLLCTLVVLRRMHFRAMARGRRSEYADGRHLRVALALSGSSHTLTLGGRATRRCYAPVRPHIDLYRPLGLRISARIRPPLATHSLLRMKMPCKVCPKFWKTHINQFACSPTRYQWWSQHVGCCDWRNKQGLCEID
jgi:hypothetical protein